MQKELADKILKQTQISYNEVAAKFASTRQERWPIMQVLADKYVKAGDRVLDVGCGNGRFYEYIYKKRVIYVGIDISENIIAEARKSLVKIAERPEEKFQVYDILDSPLNQELDVVAAFAVFSHLPGKDNQTKALDHIYHTLKAGGILMMTNWNMWQLSTKQKSIWRYKFKERQKQEKGLGCKDVMTFFKDGENVQPLYYRAFTMGEIKRLVKKAGFNVLETYYEKKGHRASWYNAYNQVIVAQKK